MSNGDTAKRTKAGVVTWLEARRFIDRNLATFREEINVSGMDVYSKAIALRELMRVWRAANLVLVRIRLPKRMRRGKRVLDEAYTVFAGDKVTLRRSRKRKGPVRSRRKGRSHHKGEYFPTNVKDGVPIVGRPKKYKDADAAKAGARVRARRSYLRRTKGRKRYVTTDKETREKRAEFLSRLKAARAEVRAEMAGERVGRAIGDFFLHRDKRHNHRTDYGYEAPHPRLRRTAAQAKRWGWKASPNKTEAAVRAARRAESSRKRKVRAALAWATSYFRKVKRMKAVHAGRDAWWKDFGHRVHAKLGWRGRRFGAKGEKHGAI